jgi:hypothetical protein
MRTDRNQAGLRELTGAETEEVSGGATTTFVIAAPRTVAAPQFVLPRTTVLTSPRIFFPRNPGLVSGGTVCW